MAIVFWRAPPSRGVNPRTPKSPPASQSHLRRKKAPIPPTPSASMLRQVAAASAHPKGLAPLLHSQTSTQPCSPWQSLLRTGPATSKAPSIPAGFRLTRPPFLPSYGNFIRPAMIRNTKSAAVNPVLWWRPLGPLYARGPPSTSSAAPSPPGSSGEYFLCQTTTSLGRVSEMTLGGLGPHRPVPAASNFVAKPQLAGLSRLSRRPSGKTTSSSTSTPKSPTARHRQ